MAGDEDGGIAPHAKRDPGDLGIPVGLGVSLVEEGHGVYAVFSGLQRQSGQIAGGQRAVQRSGQGPLQEGVQILIFLQKHVRVLCVGGQALEAVGDEFPQGADVLVWLGEHAHLGGLFQVSAFRAVPERGVRQSFPVP